MRGKEKEEKKKRKKKRKKKGKKKKSVDLQEENGIREIVRDSGIGDE
ncbi:hypothetical protein GQX38_10085 [Staphylococcus aureus]|nr:hypothetical protein [Staphylococcus aureus]